MREILFRGKSHTLDTWFYGLPAVDYFIDTISDNASTFKRVMTICELPEDLESMYRRRCDKIDPETLGQYSGKNDKNDTKIFEGDIVEFESHGYIPDITRGVVVFRDGCFGIEYSSKWYKDKLFHRIGSVSEWRDMGASGTITYTYEVIGNIHDNPELLKEEICTKQ